MKVVSFVPIKMNSQRLPHKNILPLGEHAMCWYIFSELLKCENIDEVYVYCSDSAIVDYIPQGVHFLERPTPNCLCLGFCRKASTRHPQPSR